MAAFALAARILWPGDAAGYGLNLLLDATAMLGAAILFISEERLRASRAAWALAGLGVWAALSTFWAGERLPALTTGASWLAAAALALACANGARDAAIHTLVASAGAQAAYAVWQRFWGLARLREHLKGDPAALDFISDSEKLEFVSRLNTDEPFGTFPTSNVLCAFLAVALPVMVGRALDARSAKARWLMALPALAAALAAVLTRSMGGWVALAAAGAVFAWRALFPGGNRRALAGLAAALALGAILLAARPGPFDWQNPKTSLGYRANYARGSMGIVREAPVAGVGAGNWGAHYPKHMPPTAGEAQRAHFDALQIWGELGPLGLALFLSIPLLFFSSLLKPSTTPSLPPPELPPSHDSPPTTHPSHWIAPAAGIAAAFLFNEAIEGRLSDAGFLPAAAALALLACAFVASTEAPFGRFTAAGALAGAAAFFTHGLVEYDLYVPGMAFALAAILGLAAAPAGRFRAALAAAVPAAAALVALAWAPSLMTADAILDGARSGKATAQDFADGRAANPWDSDLPYFEAGARHAGPHKPGDCLAALDAAVRLAPHQAGLAWLRGRFRWDHGERAATLDDFQRAAALYPNLAEHRYWLGKAKQEANDPSWREEYRRALELSAAADLPRRSLRGDEAEEIRKALAK